MFRVMQSLICALSFDRWLCVLILSITGLLSCNDSSDVVADKYLAFYSSKISAMLGHEWAHEISAVHADDRQQLLLFNAGNCAACRQESSLEFTQRIASEPNTLAIVISKYPLDVHLLVQQLELAPEKVYHLPDSIANELGLLFPQVVALQMEGDKVVNVIKE